MTEINTKNHNTNRHNTTAIYEVIRLLYAGEVNVSLLPLVA